MQNHLRDCHGLCLGLMGANVGHVLEETYFSRPFGHPRMWLKHPPTCQWFHPMSHPFADMGSRGRASQGLLNRTRKLSGASKVPMAPQITANNLIVCPSLQPPSPIIPFRFSEVPLQSPFTTPQFSGPLFSPKARGGGGFDLDPPLGGAGHRHAGLLHRDLGHDAVQGISANWSTR